MDNNIKKRIDKVVEKLIEQALTELKSKDEKERKKQKLYAKFLKLIKPLIIDMLNQGYEIKTINKIINDTFGIEINYITFYRWVKRNITQNEIERESKKSNIKGKATPKEKNRSNSPKNNIEEEKKETKSSNKEVKNETAEVSKKKNFDVEEYMNSNDGDNLFQKYNEF